MGGALILQVFPLPWSGPIWAPTRPARYANWVAAHLAGVSTSRSVMVEIEQAMAAAEIVTYDSSEALSAT